MKKTLLIASVVIFSIAIIVPDAQAQWEGKGSKDLNIGVGLGSTLGGGLPIGASFDVGFNENIAIGGYAGYAGYSQDFGFFKANYSYILLGARGTYHIELVENVDTYAGLMLGYNVASVSIDGGGAGNVAAGGGFLWGGIIGARYMFSDKFGGMAELGNGIAWLQIGLTVKL